MDAVLLGMLKSYIKKTLVGMGALKGAPCKVNSVTAGTDGTQTLTLGWKDDEGVTHTTDIILPAAIFKIVDVTNGQTLRYNSVSGKFENSNVSFSADLQDLDNVVITSVQNGQVLTYDAANNRWINADGSTVGDLSDLDDVVISTVQNGQYLVYDGTTNKWINATLDINADDVDYDNTTSGLAATDVQGAIDELASEKVDKEAGKGLSENDYTDADKAIVDGVTDALSGKVDKETGKGLSTNDFTDALKTKLDNIEAGAEVNNIDTVKVNGQALTPDANKAVDILMAMDKLSDVDLTDIADGMILIYDAANNKWYAGTNTGASYTAGEGINIDQNNVISSKMVLFTGTEAQWNALPLADKIKFTHYATNDDQTGQIDPVPTQNSNNLMTSGGIWTAIQNFIAKVTGATVNNFAALDASGNVIDSGKKASDFADRVTGATTNNFAGLDANGNLQDSGKKAADFATAQALENEAATRSTMGAKNLISYPYSKGTSTINGVTFTVNDDGSISADSDGSGATDTAIYRLYGFTADTKYITLPAGNYVLNGCPANGGSSNYRVFINRQGDADAYAIDDGEGATFTLDAATNIGIAIRIAKDYVADNVAIYPMIRLATDSDANYQPYAKSNKQLTDDSVDWYSNGIIGAKNLIPFPYPKESDSVLGIDFTTNSDGEINATGTSTGIAVYDVVNTELYGWNVPREGTYILSDGLSDADYEYAYTAVTFMYNDGTIEYNVGDTSIGKTVITIPSNLKNFYVGCCIRTDKTVSNIKFKPMLRMIEDSDETFRLYARTNRELTNDVRPIPVMLNELGAKNLLHCPYAGGDTLTHNGVEFTRNDDGSVTVNGTATGGNAVYSLVDYSYNKETIEQLAGKTIKITGGSALCKISSWYQNTLSVTDLGDGAEYVVPANIASIANWNISLLVSTGTTVNNLVVYPLLTLSGIDDRKYVPYAMTNKQLTDKVADMAKRVGGFTLIGDVTSSTAQSVNITGYKELLLSISASAYYFIQNTVTIDVDAYVALGINTVQCKYTDGTSVFTVEASDLTASSCKLKSDGTRHAYLFGRS